MLCLVCIFLVGIGHVSSTPFGVEENSSVTAPPSLSQAEVMPLWCDPLGESRDFASLAALVAGAAFNGAVMQANQLVVVTSACNRAPIEVPPSDAPETESPETLAPGDTAAPHVSPPVPPPYQVALPKVFHPTGVAVGPEGRRSSEAGAVLLGLGMLAGSVVVWRVLGMVLGVVLPRIDTSAVFSVPPDPYALARFPSAPIFVLKWCYQGCTLAAFSLCIYGFSERQIVLGGVALFVCMVLPMVILFVIRYEVPSSAIVVNVPETGLISSVLFGDGEWISRDPKRQVASQWGCVVRPFTEKRVWFGTIYFASSFALSGMSSVRVDTSVECAHIRSAQSVLFALCLISEVAAQPHARPRDAILTFMIYAANCVATALLSVAYHTHTTFPHEVAVHLLQGSAVLIITKIVLDLLCGSYLLWSGRRRHLEQDFWEMQEEGEGEGDGEGVPMESQKKRCEVIAPGMGGVVASELCLPSLLRTVPSDSGGVGLGGTGASGGSLWGGGRQGTDDTLASSPAKFPLLAAEPVVLSPLARSGGSLL